MKIFLVTAALLIFSYQPVMAVEEAPFEMFTTVSCTNSTSVALAANSGRLAALLINDGTSSIYLKIGEDAVANEGIRLNANGGSYYISANEYNRDNEAVNCITIGTTEVLLVVEWSR